MDIERAAITALPRIRTFSFQASEVVRVPQERLDGMGVMGLTKYTYLLTYLLT
jgi:hypothetical protein